MQKLWPVKVTVGKLSETVSDTDSRQEKLDETVSRVDENLTKLDGSLKPVTAAENCATAETRKRLGKLDLDFYDSDKNKLRKGKTTSN